MLETAEGKNTNDIRALQAQKTTLEQNYSRDILQLKEEKGKLETIHTTVLATLENQAKKLEKIAEEHKAEISSLEAENKTLAETQNQALTKLHAAKEKLKRLEAGARAVDRLQTENERLQRELRAVWDSFRSDEIIAYALGQLALRLKEPLEHPPGLPSVVEEARESIHKLVEALVTAAYQKVHDQVGDYIDTLLARKTGSNISPEKQANAHRLVPGVKERINKLGK
jgi:chromosome segregation ATPase